MVQTIYRRKVIEKNNTHLVFKGLNASSELGNKLRVRKHVTCIMREFSAAFSLQIVQLASLFVEE